MSPHPLVAYQAGRTVVHIALGRLIAGLILGGLLWLSVSADRTRAIKDLNRLTERGYAAGYANHRQALKQAATKSDGYLIGVAGMLLLFVAAYEGAAWTIGWGLGSVDTALRRPRDELGH